MCKTRHTRGGGRYSRWSPYECVLQIRVKSKSIDKVIMSKEGVYYKNKYGSLYLCVWGPLTPTIVHKWCFKGGYSKGAITLKCFKYTYKFGYRTYTCFFNKYLCNVPFYITVIYTYKTFTYIIAIHLQLCCINVTVAECFRVKCLMWNGFFLTVCHWSGK